nr:ATP-grasp fold amidoligase family protein [Allobacillus saliphilus]
MAAEDVSEPLVRSALSDDPLSLQSVSSFRGSLTKRIRQHQLNGPLSDWILDDKSVAYQFVDQLGIRRPTTSEIGYTKDELPLNEGTVIKPLDGAGARGVYLLHTANNIVDIKRNQTLRDTEQLREQMEKDIQTKWVSEDSWGYEELIYENQENKQPARDLKFYSFYGKTPLILEIIRYPEMQYCWWTSEGKPLLTGKYNDQLFKGEGFTQEELEQVNEISRQIPSPFMRIDFLRGEEGLVFGEFTPKPGNYDEFDETIDRWLGDCFLEAENRLVTGMLHGKKFDAFSDILKV